VVHKTSVNSDSLAARSARQAFSMHWYISIMSVICVLTVGVVCKTYTLCVIFIMYTNRGEVDPSDVPQLYAEGAQSIIRLAQHTVNDSMLVQMLMLSLQVQCNHHFHGC
jgi:hypothetical protein